MEEDILKKILLFINRERGVYRKKITLDTSLETDLKLTGDDAYDFFLAFSKEFNVDVENFKISDYFADEGSFELMKLVLFGIHTKKKDFKIRRLVEAIKDSKLER
jgi:hypothetical protein